MMDPNPLRDPSIPPLGAAEVVKQWTPAEWQPAADTSSALLALEDLRRTGELRTGIKVNRAACVQILAYAELAGVKPRPTALRDYVARN